MSTDDFNGPMGAHWNTSGDHHALDYMPIREVTLTLHDGRQFVVVQGEGWFELVDGVRMPAEKPEGVHVWFEGEPMPGRS